MLNVRKQQLERALRRADKKKDAGRAARPEHETGLKVLGEGQDDPRLFYFRAILESDRFFKQSTPCAASSGK